MSAEHDNPGVVAAPPGSRFTTTQWSLVIAAAHSAEPGGHEALAELCRLYWYPLYAFVRRRGYSADDALDLTQGFFERLLEKNGLATVDAAKGRFRSWLLGAMKHYLSNQRERQNARKRGGGTTILSIDADDAERRYRYEPGHELTPERVFDRRWALTLLDRVLADLAGEFRRAGKEGLFDALSPMLSGEERMSYDAISQRLGMTEGAVRVAAHRMRQRYGQRLREEIGRTVEGEEAVEQEIHDLFEALA
jgi:RNA polymerase sigma-70 factor (ECF subfamily)